MRRRMTIVLLTQNADDGRLFVFVFVVVVVPVADNDHDHDDDTGHVVRDGHLYYQYEGHLQYHCVVWCCIRRSTIMVSDPTMKDWYISVK